MFFGWLCGNSSRTPPSLYCHNFCDTCRARSAAMGLGVKVCKTNRLRLYAPPPEMSVPSPPREGRTLLPVLERIQEKYRFGKPSNGMG